MPRLALYLSAATLGLGLASTAAAQDFTFTANVGATTDYVFRGISQSNEHPALQVGADAGYGIGYAGVWTSTVDFTGDPTAIEADLYGGVKPAYAGFNFDFGFIYYDYIGQPRGHPDDYWEFKAAVSHAAGPATVGAAVFYSPDFFGETDEAWYYEVNGSAPLTKKLSVSGALGRQDVSYAGDYTTWNVGANYALTSRLGVDVRYWDTDHHDYHDIYDSRVVGSIKVLF